MSLKIKKETLLQYFLIYWLLLDAGSAAAFVTIGSDAYFLSLLALGFGVCVYYHRTSRFQACYKYEFQVFFYILVVSMLCTFLVTFGEMYITIVVSVIGRIVIVVAAVTVNPQEFLVRFIRTVSFLAIISLFIFCGYFIGGIQFWSFIAGKLPVVRSASYTIGAQYGSFLLCFNYFDPTRNSYIFGEPGEYQVVLSAALFLLLFSNHNLGEKERKRHMAVLIITMISTQSTSGYFSMIGLLFFWVIERVCNQTLSVNQLQKILILGGVAFIVLGYFGVDDYFVSKVLTEKVIDEAGQVNFNQGTASARWEGFILLGKYILDHPLDCILGIGYGGRVASHAITSCNGLTNTIADFGIVSVGWILYCYSKSLFKYVSRWGALAGLFVILNIWIGQPVAIYTLIIVIAFAPMLTAPKWNEKRDEGGYPYETQRISL